MSRNSVSLESKRDNWSGESFSHTVLTSDVIRLSQNQVEEKRFPGY